MAEVTEAQILAKVEELRNAFADGFQFEDVNVVLKAAVSFAQVAELTGPERKALALQVLERVIDTTDTPWLPDNWTDPLMKKLLPGLIDTVVDAAQGKLGITEAPQG